MSYFLQAFLDGEQVATYLTGDLRNELLHSATSEITRRYYELAAELVSVVCRFLSILSEFSGRHLSSSFFLSIPFVLDTHHK